MLGRGALARSGISTSTIPPVTSDWHPSRCGAFLGALPEQFLDQLHDGRLDTDVDVGLVRAGLLDILIRGRPSRALSRVRQVEDLLDLALFGRHYLDEELRLAL